MGGWQKTWWLSSSRGGVQVGWHKLQPQPATFPVGLHLTRRPPFPLIYDHGLAGAGYRVEVTPLGPRRWVVLPYWLPTAIVLALAVYARLRRRRTGDDVGAAGFAVVTNPAAPAAESAR